MKRGRGRLLMLCCREAVDLRWARAADWHSRRAASPRLRAPLEEAAASPKQASTMHYSCALLLAAIMPTGRASSMPGLDAGETADSGLEIIDVRVNYGERT